MADITVEQALKELRAMFPEFHMRTITVYDPEPGGPYVTISLSTDDDHDPQEVFMRATVADCMRAVRAFKASQEGRCQ